MTTFTDTFLVTLIVVGIILLSTKWPRITTTERMIYTCVILPNFLSLMDNILYLTVQYSLGTFLELTGVTVYFLSIVSFIIYVVEIHKKNNLKSMRLAHISMIAFLFNSCIISLRVFLII